MKQHAKSMSDNEMRVLVILGVTSLKQIQTIKLQVQVSALLNQSFEMRIFTLGIHGVER